MNTKETNPKDAIGIKKVPISTIPGQVLAELGLAMLEGLAKYGRHNYRVSGARSSVYYDAVGRHMLAWWEGQDIDPGSGLSHITKAMASLAVLRDCMLQDNLVDDRPPPVKDQMWVDKFNILAANILGRYPDPPPPCTKKTEA